MMYLFDPHTQFIPQIESLYEALSLSSDIALYSSLKNDSIFLKQAYTSIESIELQKKSFFTTESTFYLDYLHKSIPEIQINDTILTTDIQTAINLAKAGILSIGLFIFHKNQLDQSIIKQIKKYEDIIHCLVPSDFATQELRLKQIDSRQIHKVSMPFLQHDVPKKEGHQSFILGSVAPLYPENGVETIIQALHEVEELLPQLKVIIIGEGPEKRRLLWLIEHLHLRKKVQLIGNARAYERFLPNIDVLVQASPKGAFFTPHLLQAMGYGIPIIATNIGYQTDLITHNEQGLLFEPNNITMLSQHIINLYNHPEWAQHYKQNGQALLSKTFTKDHFFKELSDAFEIKEATS